MKKPFKFGNNKGFTLVELIITVAIIGILSLMVLQRFGCVKDYGYGNYHHHYHHAEDDD